MRSNISRKGESCPRIKKFLIFKYVFYAKGIKKPLCLNTADAKKCVPSGFGRVEARP